MTIDQKKAVALAMAKVAATQGNNDPYGLLKRTDMRQDMQKASEAAKAILLNTPGSAVGFAKNIISVFAHPIDTFTNLKDLSKGIYYKFTSGVQPEEKLVDAMSEYFKNRYGGEEQLRNTITTDPIGFASDLSLMIGAIGKATALSGKIANIKALSSTGEKISKAGVAVNPISLAQKANPLRLFPKGAEIKMYQSSVKMPQKLGKKKLTPLDRERIAQTGLDNGIIPNAKGYVKLLDKIDDANKKISESIKSARGKTVSTDKIVSTLDDLKDFYKNTINPKPFIDELEDIAQGMRKAWGNKIPIEQAQKIKQNTYVLLRKHYGELKSMSIEAQKALARGIKDQIVSVHPEIASLNKADSALLELEGVIEKAASRISNRDLVGIGVPIKATATAAGDAAGGALPGLLAGIIDTPTIKAKIAVAINNARKTDVTKYGKAKTAANMAFQAGGLNE